MIEQEGEKWQPTEPLLRMAANWMMPLPAVAHESVLMADRDLVRAAHHLVAVRGNGPLWVIDYPDVTGANPTATLKSMDGASYLRLLSNAIAYSTVYQATSPGRFQLKLSSGLLLELAQGTRFQAQDFGFGGAEAFAEVVPNPDDPSVLGLKNLTDRAWSVSTPQGGQRTVEPGRSIRLATTTKIDFGNARGEVTSRMH